MPESICNKADDVQRVILIAQTITQIKRSKTKGNNERRSDPGEACVHFVSINQAAAHSHSLALSWLGFLGKKNEKETAHSDRLIECLLFNKTKRSQRTFAVLLFFWSVVARCVGFWCLLRFDLAQCSFVYFSRRLSNWNLFPSYILSLSRMQCK